MTNPTRVAVIDDHPLYLGGVKRTFRMDQDFAIVATGGSATEACQIAARERPDVLLLDIGIPGNGIEALQMIRRAAPEVRVVMLTASAETEHMTRSLELGAQGYILKDINGVDLLAALRSIVRGERFITTNVLERRRPRAGDESQAEPALRLQASLNNRESQILELLADGLSNREISQKTKLPIRTIKYLLLVIFGKIGVRNRVEAVLYITSKNASPLN